MPELPEVQCVVNSLQRIVGKKIVGVRSFTDRLREPVQQDLTEKLVGKTIHQISRRGKFIVFNLDKGAIVAHLGMTGAFLLNPDEGKHDRVRLELDGGEMLVYNDARKFGFVMYEDDHLKNKYLKKLGVEPLSEYFSGSVLYELSRRGRNVKAFLLDQAVVAGLGNIYVIEVMYLCGISPLRVARSLSAQDCDNLAVAIKVILRDSIEKGGSSISDYRDADNKVGSFQDGFHVYGRKTDHGGNEVIRISQGGRGTYYCPAVQG